MKLIEAMKSVKELKRKSSDLRDKVKMFCADYEHENPAYGDKQKEQIKSWLDSHRDIVKQILDLKLKIQKTNISTLVTITLDGKDVEQSISAWILRRGQGVDLYGLAHEELAMWSQLTDRGLKEGKVASSTGVIETKIRRYYDPALRDRMKELYISEPQIIDATLEVVNARTDLVE